MGRPKKVKTEMEEVVSIKKRPEMEKNESFVFASSGSTLLDLVLGGGLPYGKIVNIVGDKSSGKTAIAIETIANAVKKSGLKIDFFYDDAESGFSFDTKKIYGVDISSEDSSSTVEDFEYKILKKIEEIKKDHYLIYVLDSLDGLSSEAEHERKDKEYKARDKGKVVRLGTFGMEKQKRLSEFFRVMSGKIKEKNCLLIIISQIRDKIGVMFGEKTARTGGRALDFYASQVIWLSETEKKKKQERTVGIRVKAKCKKNKIGKPFRECYIDLLFDYGTDDITSNINFLYDLVDARGKTSIKKLEWDGKEYNPAALVKFVETESLEEELKSRVIEKWESIENDISCKDRKNKW